MADNALVRAGRTAAVVGAMLAVFGSLAMVMGGHAGTWWADYGAFIALFSVFFGVFVWMVITQQPRNAVVGVMAVSALCGGLFLAGWGLATLSAEEADVLLSGGGLVPAELPVHTAWILVLTVPPILVALYGWMTFGLLLFPDGRLPSPRWRWRWLGWAAAVGIALATVGEALEYLPSATQPVDEDNPVLLAGWFIATVVTVGSLAALVVRFRRSRGQTREQFKWVVWGASIFVPVFVAIGVAEGSRFEDALLVPLMLAEAVLLISYGIAVGKYRLFDIDVVISRTLIVAGLAGFITVVYAVVVGGVGLLLGTRVEAELPLSIAATVLVAIAFQPVRERMNRWADRLVHGERATPYEVLSRFSARMRDAVAADELIPQMAQLLAAGTGATRSTVWLRAGDELRPIAVWPAGDPLPAVPHLEGVVTIPDVDHVSIVEHDGEMLGAVSVTLPRGETITVTEQRLVDDVAAQAGLVLRNARLTAELVDTIDELRASRQRLVAAQDAERRRLERDLHDGAQQQFIAVKLKAAMAKRIAEQRLGLDDQTTELLGQVVAEVDEGVQSLRDLAHGIYPPLLEAEGLAAALSSRSAKMPVEVVLNTHNVGRYPREVEAAVYFCVLEALQNVVKYADATQVTVDLDEDAGSLRFTVTDDGRGFDLEQQQTGRGLSNMTDRIDALGGQLLIRSAPAAGTSITGELAVVREVVTEPEAVLWVEQTPTSSS